MRRLTEQDIVHIWEIGLGQHSLDQALTMLLAAFPEASYEKLVALSIGQRDACLFTLREQTLGPMLRSVATCPACQEHIEFVLNTADMPIVPNLEPVEQIFTLATDKGELSFRLPVSLDLAAIVGSQDLVAARTQLIQRCILHAVHDGKEVAIETLPESLLLAMAAHMDACDPLAAIDIPLDCITCGCQWYILFDIVSFLWTEITAQAKRLLHEVHILARQYSWREADILSMSSARRQLYLEMVK